jgi:hemin uptake protein HemP
MEMSSKNQRLPARQEKRAIDVDSHSTQAPVVDSDSLFGGRNEVIVRHGELLYRLRITRNGKLVMNK